MRNLLFLAHRIPYPPDKGDKIRSFHVLRHLSSRFRIYLGCFFDDAADQQHIATLRNICAEVFCLPLSPTQKLMLALRGAIVGKSMSESVYWNRQMADWVRTTLDIHRMKDMFVFSSSMSVYVDEYRGDRRTVIDIVDVDSEKWGAYARSARWPVSMFYEFEQRQVLALEKRAAAVSDQVLFVSKAEEDTFVRLAPELGGRVRYMENGVDGDRFNPAIAFSNPFGPECSAVVFTGAMNYRPNVDAVCWFAREVFPAVRRACAHAQFWIVGGNPAASVRRLSRRPGIKLAHRVPDVRPYLAHARCAVAPLRIARGIQNKVLEAMAMGKPVVLTPAAFEGLSAIPDRELLVASDPASFARHVIGILQNPTNPIGVAARSRIERDYCWEKNLEVLDALYQQSAAAVSLHASQRSMSGI
jgi:sugar transferase (PEP-CTERM/EpsH1 system associated)